MQQSPTPAPSRQYGSELAPSSCPVHLEHPEFQQGLATEMSAHPRPHRGGHLRHLACEGSTQGPWRTGLAVAFQNPDPIYHPVGASTTPHIQPSAFPCAQGPQIHPSHPAQCLLMCSGPPHVCLLSSLSPSQPVPLVTASL